MTQTAVLKRTNGEGTWEVLSVAPLTEADLCLLEEYGPHRGANSIKELRARHHEVARLLALGRSHAEISRRTGFAYNTINKLENSPAFQELLAKYQEQRTAQVFNLGELFHLVTEESLGRLLEVLDDPEWKENLSPQDLVKILTSSADRSGYSPVQRTESRVLLMRGDLEDLKREANLAEASRGVVVHTNRRDPAPEAGAPALEGGSPQDRGPGERETPSPRREPSPQAPQVDWFTSQGQNI